MSLEPLPHSPVGAGVTFYFGPPGAPAGFRSGDRPFVPQDVYVGCRHDENAPWSLLPAFAARPATLEPLPRGRYGRFLAWAGDKWMIGPLVFKLCTPFPLEKTDDEQFWHAPVVCGYLEYDNSHSSAAAELVFGIGVKGTPLDSSEVRGWQFSSGSGFATNASAETTAVAGSDVFGTDLRALNALKFTVPPHSKRIFPLVLAWHSPDLHANRWFPDFPSVLAYGLKHHARYIALSDRLDAEFMLSPVSFDEKTELARGTRIWLASTSRRFGDREIDLSPLQQIAARIRSRAPQGVERTTR